MTLAPMRFMDFTWHHNPKTLSIQCGKQIKEFNYPYTHSESVFLGEHCRVIRGTGELYGEDCIEQFNALCRLYSKKETGLLTLPQMPSVWADFTELKFISSERKNIVDYAFTFTEKHTERNNVNVHIYHTVKTGETLWDISYAYETAVEALAQLNPWIRTPESLSPGEQVKIC